ncbi:MAG TPA: glycoside hydrolase family 3 C-terminal domain-containing protein [Polyangia bacterium]
MSLTLASVGCRPQPTTVIEGGSGGSGSGSGGTNGTGGSTSGSGGAGTTGSGGAGTTGSGGSGTTGSGGSGTTGSGGAGTTGSGGSGTTGSGGSGKMACADTTPAADPKAPGYSDAQHNMYNTMASSLLANLSASEKADQMRGTPQPATTSATYYDDIFRQPDNTTHMVKGFKFRDGPRGVNLDAKINGGGSKGRSTVFPVPAARGATFDVDLEYQIGQAMGDEMVAAGQSMLLSPTTNILRNPLWGRSQETYGEDVYLLGRMGTAAVAGIQEYVPACAKHYAANNIENSRAMKTATMDERTLREIYARHFEMMVRDGGVACVMGAYNPLAVTGKTTASCTQNKFLLTDVLKTDFGFQGFIMTDWWALSGNQATATGTATTAAAGVNAGLDMELPMSINYKLLETIVGSTITQTQIDAAAKRVLEQKFRFNVVTGNGLKTSSSSFSGGSIFNQTHIDLSEKTAREAMVLLQNKNNVLPLKKMGKIAVIGTKEDYWAATTGAAGINNRADDINNGTIDFPNGVRVGDVGSSRVDFDPAKAISPFQGIQQAAGSSATVTSGNDASAAAGADAIVIVAGLTPYDEGEEYNGSGDRSVLDLNGKLNKSSQNNLIMQVAAANAGKPIIVILEGGGAINVMPWKDMVSAIVMAWYPGMVGGQAMGELLFGDQNFSGKLPVTWPSDINQFPTFDGGGSTAMDYYLGYRYFENKGTKPLYPFGYGLSYSGPFQYANLQIPCSSAKAPAGTSPGSIVNVQFDVTNAGTVKGTEVAFLFVSFPMVSKQLKGFVRVDVDAGKTTTATIPLRIADLKYWDSGSSSWKYPSGPVSIMVGRSSAGNDDTKDDLMLTDTLTIN